MRNLILIFALFVGFISNAQGSIEVNPFVNNGIDYIHVMGGQNTNTICYDNVEVGIQRVYTLTSNRIVDLTYGHSYQIADEAIRADFNSFINANEVRLASDNSLYSGPNLLVCPENSGWTLGTDWYSNVDYPGYFYQPFAGTAVFAYVPNGGTCEGNAACQSYSPAGHPNAFALESFNTTPFFSSRVDIEAYFLNLIARHRAN